MGDLLGTPGGLRFLPNFCLNRKSHVPVTDRRTFFALRTGSLHAQTIRTTLVERVDSYLADSTEILPNLDVKLRRARVVLG